MKKEEEWKKFCEEVWETIRLPIEHWDTFPMSEKYGKIFQAGFGIGGTAGIVRKLGFLRDGNTILWGIKEVFDGDEIAFYDIEGQRYFPVDGSPPISESWKKYLAGLKKEFPEICKETLWDCQGRGLGLMTGELIATLGGDK